MIHWLKDRSLEEKLLLALGAAASLIAIAVIAFLVWFIEPATREELGRVRSPDGTLDAISTRYDVGLGATVGFWYELFIQQAGSPPLMNPGQVSGQVFDSDRAYITQVRWAGPNRLVIAAEVKSDFKDAPPRRVEIPFGNQRRTVEIEFDPKPYVQEYQNSTAARVAP